MSEAINQYITTRLRHLEADNCRLRKEKADLQAQLQEKEDHECCDYERFATKIEVHNLKIQVLSLESRLDHHAHPVDPIDPPQPHGIEVSIHQNPDGSTEINHPPKVTYEDVLELIRKEPDWYDGQYAAALLIDHSELVEIMRNSPYTSMTHAKAQIIGRKL